MTTANILSQLGSPGVSTGFKNRIINGAMTIDQRAFSGSAGAGTYTLDRWATNSTQSSKFTVAQSSTAPSGFSNSLLVTSSSAYSVTSGDYFNIYQPIEGYNFADLGWGTASAKAVTISFQVYSSLTGTFGGALVNFAQTRSYPFSYTVSSANTWTTITVNIAGDTSGTWVGATNGVGVYVIFGLGTGSTYSGTANTWASAAYYAPTGATSVVGTNGATWYITGVQLEVGTTATNFDVRSYGTELALCQRYFEAIYADNSSLCIFSTPYSSQQRAQMWYRVQKRATSTFALATGASWQSSTPDSITSGLTQTNFYSASALFYLIGTANAPCATISAEL